MKKLILFLFVIPFLAAAQQPFGKDATWHFSYSAFGYNGFKKVAYHKDTVINNQNWQLFNVSGLSELRTGPGPNDLIQDTNVAFPNVLLSSRNDSVFYFDAQGQVKLLFDFTASIGDKWTFANPTSQLACPQMPEATVVEIGYDTINGQALKYWEIENPMDTFILQNQPVYMCASGYCLPTKIYENIGCEWYSTLFNPSPNICNGSVINLAINNLRCFSNNSIAVNFTNQPCDYWSLIGVVEKELSQLKIFPNPSSGSLFVESEQEPALIEVFDVTGKKVREAELATQIDLPQNSGLYILTITFKNGEKIIRKVVRK